MTKHVRICPRCAHHNAEQLNACERDGEFLGLEPAVPEFGVGRQEKPAKPNVRQGGVDAIVSCCPSNAAPVNRKAPGTPAVTKAAPEAIRLGFTLYLEIPASDRVIAVPAGSIVGQAHPTGLADLEIDGVEGQSYIHRRHARIEEEGGRWYVTPLDQAEFGRGFTNPTCVNGRLVPPGSRAPLSDGDRLTLAGTHFVVRVP